jgi:hypothetical protein
MRLEDLDATTRHHPCPDCHAAAGDPHLAGCPSDESDAAVERARQQDAFRSAMATAQGEADAREAREATAAVTALLPAGKRFRTKDDLFRFLGGEATRRKGAPLRDSERRVLWRGHHLVWADGDVHETPAACPSTSPARTVRAGAIA